MRKTVTVAFQAAAMLVALAACNAGSPTGPTPARGAPRVTHRIGVTTVLAFGDSITLGLFSPAPNSTMSLGPWTSYPARLQVLLSARYQGQTIVVQNGGAAGERAAVAADRLSRWLRAANPNVVILLDGVNDIVASGAVGGLAALTALRSMADEVKASGGSVILCTLLPQRVGGIRAADPFVVAAFNELVRELAREEGVRLVDLARELDVSLIGFDGLHPTEAGYVRMANVIFAALRELFEQPPWLH
jgi:lysophospholipase L1-like esterase